MNLVLELQGYTNINVVRCVYDKSPLQFYANIYDDSVLNNQLEILKLAWPNINKIVFFKDVCSSSLEKRVWMNRKELVPNHNIKLQIPNVSYEELLFIFNLSMGSAFVRKKGFTTIEHVVTFLKNEMKYPTNQIDFIPLILKKCDPYAIGLKRNTIYYLSKPPQL